MREEDQRFIQKALKEGRYLSESEAVADAIDGLRAHDAMREAHVATLRTAIAIGIGEADRGEFIDFTADEIIAERRATIAVF